MPCRLPWWLVRQSPPHSIALALPNALQAALVVGQTIALSTSAPATALGEIKATTGPSGNATSRGGAQAGVAGNGAGASLANATSSAGAKGGRIGSGGVLATANVWCCCQRLACTWCRAGLLWAEGGG